jgi:hypothetical protein
MFIVIKGVFGRAPPERHLQRSRCCFGEATDYDSSKTATTLFPLKNGSSYEIFGRAPLKEQGRSPAKQTVIG